MVPVYSRRRGPRRFPSGRVVADLAPGGERLSIRSRRSQMVR